jgi:hypothetical protein
MASWTVIYAGGGLTSHPLTQLGNHPRHGPPNPPLVYKHNGWDILCSYC